MSSLLAVQGSFVQITEWIVLGVVGVVGFLALVSPKSFSALAMRGGQWFDSSRVLAKLDTKVDVDKYVLPHSRILGAVVLAAVGLLAYFFLLGG